ncbi:hypothetical protein [Yimella sp. cx-51]|uniref:hypothetical protein n=1 Tax=Yimella sp. cx-51 TaxID=2770551 RepID=UPI00165DA9E2|nr:hypothetical protein [Yimella sp. cx-51]MBC9956939.1 hypothetical protein [Yimella sp. cx-51]QTH39158.1 hypothetical protein J5M86_05965 [Yimella sp. cx-51]
MQLEQRADFADRHSAIDVARAALNGLNDGLFQAPGTVLTQFMTEVDDLVRLAAAARVAITAEAVQRGEVLTSTSRRTLAWVRS